MTIAAQPILRSNRRERICAAGRSVTGGAVPILERWMDGLSKQASLRRGMGVVALMTDCSFDGIGLVRGFERRIRAVAAETNP